MPLSWALPPFTASAKRSPLGEGRKGPCSLVSTPWGVEQGQRRGAQLRWLGWEHGEDVQGSHTSPLREKGKSPLLLESSVFPEHRAGQISIRVARKEISSGRKQYFPNVVNGPDPGCDFC